MLHDFGGDLHHLVDLDLLPESPVVVDAGACIGDFAAAMLELRPKAKIVCIEPSKRNRALLRNLLGKRVEIIPAALAAYAEVVDIHEPIGEGGRYYQWATIHPDLYSRANQRPDLIEVDVYQVNCITIDFLLEHFGRIDYLKMDIEGSESAILERGISPAMVRQVSIEMHLDYSLDKRLNELGFEAIERRDSEIYARSPQ